MDTLPVVQLQFIGNLTDFQTLHDFLTRTPAAPRPVAFQIFAATYQISTPASDKLARVYYRDTDCAQKAIRLHNNKRTNNSSRSITATLLQPGRYPLGDWTLTCPDQSEWLREEIKKRGTRQNTGLRIAGLASATTSDPLLESHRKAVAGVSSFINRLQSAPRL